MKKWFRRERKERRDLKTFLKDGWPEVKENGWNFLGLGIGMVLGTGGILVMINVLGNTTARPLAVVSVAAGIVAFAGAVLRVWAHFHPGPRGKGVDLTGKTLAMAAALQVALLGLYELELLPTGM